MPVNKGHACPPALEAQPRRGAVTIRLGVGVWRGSGPSPPVPVGPPGGKLLSRCPLVDPGLHGGAICLHSASAQPGGVTAGSRPGGCWWPAPGTAQAGAPGRGTGAWLLGQGRRLYTLLQPHVAFVLLRAVSAPVWLGSVHLRAQPCGGARPVPQGLTPSCCW